MPTGYTEAIKNGISFKEYAMRCARAFGACFMMRDDPFDKEIPERFEPSDYHSKALEKAKRKLAELKARTAEQWENMVFEYNENARYAYNRRVQESNDLRDRYETMLAAVDAYQSPSPDHDEFKEFMYSQIVKSMRFDCYDWDEPKVLNLDDFIAQELETANRNIKYHTEKYADEVKRTESRNEWIRLLRESLKDA